MTNRIKNMMVSFAALLAGGLLYIWLRPNTYIGNILDGLLGIDLVRQIGMNHAGDFLKYYLPDFLWGSSLGCALIAVYDPRIRGVIICAGVSVLCGSLWEVLQYAQVIKGTGDIHDVIMYLLAGAMCIIINLKERRKE